MEMQLRDIEAKINQREAEMTAIEEHFPGGHRDIRFWARCDDGEDNPDRPSVRLAKLASKWVSLYEGLKVLEELQAQKLNPLALDQYRSDLQR